MNNSDNKKIAPWSERMRKVLSRLRKGAEGYSEEEINEIVDHAVKAVRMQEAHVRQSIEAGIRDSDNDRTMDVKKVRNKFGLKNC